MTNWAFLRSNVRQVNASTWSILFVTCFQTIDHLDALVLFFAASTSYKCRVKKLWSHWRKVSHVTAKRYQRNKSPLIKWAKAKIYENSQYRSPNFNSIENLFLLIRKRLAVDAIKQNITNEKNLSRDSHRGFVKLNRASDSFWMKTRRVTMQPLILWRCK